MHSVYNITSSVAHCENVHPGVEVVVCTFLAGVGSRERDLRRYYYIEHVRFDKQILFLTQSFTDYCTKYMLVVSCAGEHILFRQCI